MKLYLLHSLYHDPSEAVVYGPTKLLVLLPFIATSPMQLHYYNDNTSLRNE